MCALEYPACTVIERFGAVCGDIGKNETALQLYIEDLWHPDVCHQEQKAGPATDSR